ncbi:hypothetical protein [Dyella sp. A6]|uniref:hypothetical protein n=1 Tax=Dyella aluminiiresistens TaxID=3069105 RepID=UPI002E7A29A0|nr:hypothetical protein [Dyella sp. A6]
MRPTAIDPARRFHLLAIALSWLAIGVVLLLTTLVPAHTALLGWAPMLWLLGAPLAMLLVLEPALPMRLLGRSRRRPRSAHHGWR